MPRNYKIPPAGKLYGEANALTIATVGRHRLNAALFELKLPILAQWMHMRTDIESLWTDGSLRNAVAYFSGKLRATGRDITREIVVPLVIREGCVLDPASFRASDKTEVWTKEGVDKLFIGAQFPRPLLDREYIYAPPPMPGFNAPNRTVIDPYRPTSMNTERNK